MTSPYFQANCISSNFSLPFIQSSPMSCSFLPLQLPGCSPFIPDYTPWLETGGPLQQTHTSPKVSFLECDIYLLKIQCLIISYRIYFKGLNLICDSINYYPIISDLSPLPLSFPLSSLLFPEMEFQLGCPSEIADAKCWMQGVPRQSCVLLWSQTHQCKDQFHLGIL